MIMKLDFSSPKKAVKSLGRAITRTQKAPSDEELRDAVIQRFEYTYELAWKMMKRQIEQEAPNPDDIDQLSFKDLLRTAAEKGIIADVEAWLIYREQRNITSHTYDEVEAKSVYETALKFLKDAEVLLSNLEKRRS
ncbi:MAG: nucleotidyltransferase [Deltaproteobacteria bacterium CG11_big_fil_rev_8_21_14_0_20_49_13]|nr:MAG: nucleotidyltransferase [Deltaproteobacteria bacterium CG11_big_fil_rev_8_21_14_0_20_49_13]